MVCDAYSIKIDSSFKYDVIFEAPEAHSLFRASFINSFREERNFVKKKEAKGGGSLLKQNLKE